MIHFYFNTSPAMQGQNTIHIAACAFFCGDGCVPEFTCTFLYEPPTPTPTPTATATATPTAGHSNSEVESKAAASPNPSATSVALS